MSEIPADAIARGPAHEEVYWDALRKVRIEDERTLACTLGGRPVRILHYSHAPKAWTRAAHSRIHPDDAFVCLLPRLLFADDVTLRLDPVSVPLWLRPGRAERTATVALGLANGLRGMVERRDIGPVVRRLRMRGR